MCVFSTSVFVRVLDPSLFTQLQQKSYWSDPVHSHGRGERPHDPVSIDDLRCCYKISKIFQYTELQMNVEEHRIPIKASHQAPVIWLLTNVFYRPTQLDKVLKQSVNPGSKTTSAPRLLYPE